MLLKGLQTSEAPAPMILRLGQIGDIFMQIMGVLLCVCKVSLIITVLETTYVDNGA